MAQLNKNTVYSRARRLGYRIRKLKRQRSSGNHGECMLVKTVLGERYDATLEEINEFLLAEANSKNANLSDAT